MRFTVFKSTESWNIVLLTAVFLTIFVVPSLPYEYQAYTARILYTIMYFTAILSLEKRRKSLFYLSIVTLFLEWVSGVFDLHILTVVARASNMVFFVLIVIFLIRQVARASKVNAKVILSSITGYFLMGIIFSLFIVIIMQMDPGAYNCTNSTLESTNILHFSESVYFSFVTLATLGYGDIVPLKPYTRSLSVLITVSGQLYIAILVALLVGKFASGSNVPEE